METWPFHDGNIHHLVDTTLTNARHDVGRSLQMHSSLIQRLSQERELKDHKGCVNALAWNLKGTLLLSGSDDTQVNVWNYSGRKLLHSIETGHSGNIFCVKFVPETSDELVVSGAGDSQVRLFNLSRLGGRGHGDGSIAPSAVYHCHTKRVKKLAVEVGNPNVVWSASEDGTLRQHDFREGTSCPPAGSSHQECRNVLLDLRYGGKRSLADPPNPKHTLALKSCDISSTRPHLLLVGGNDSFARLYDRRMLPPLTSSQKRMSPPPCVNYFCPMHLSDRGHLMQLTHVTFSPSGEEVLLSYSGEHVYLMDVDCVNGSAMKYTSGDTSKLLSFTPILSRVEHEGPMSDVVQNDYQKRNISAERLEKCRMLVDFAKKSLEEGKDHFYAIEACHEVLDGYGTNVGSTLMHECLCTRAALLLKRNWKNDVHMAIRDCYNARRIDGSSVKALYCMSEALEQLNKHKEALEFAMAAQCLAPSNTVVAEKVESIKNKISAAEAEKGNRSEPRFEARTGRVLSLSDILRHSGPNSDASEDGPRSEREDSDYDEEVEFNFETQISGDEGHDVESLHGSLNLRIHRDSNGSCGSPSTSSQVDRASYQPEVVIDMKQRFVGHCNVGTDIKQASFLGQRGEYIASGSDDGRWFIWEKQTGRLIKMLRGDEAVVNCVQCHPFDCVVATSGIDSTIKMWTPTASIPSIVAGGSAGPETADVLKAMEDNQKSLIDNRRAIFAHDLLEQIQMHEGSLHPFECVQS
ncbi:hypothetical protein SLEP1_g20950 [Rubroshorea leprosula]|uniref:WD and tetratricopeptide repeats protein 1 n=1 Tax=Rubroshorea leprosula TaxID=152421 RepID=A0AAV5JAG4_9ROSI|nr:hypothetical protein SLEP1_g20950 [Rubroshorea leprosula]